MIQTTKFKHILKQASRAFYAQSEGLTIGRPILFVLSHASTSHLTVIADLGGWERNKKQNKKQSVQPEQDNLNQANPLPI